MNARSSGGTERNLCETEIFADVRKRGFRIARNTLGIGVKFALPPGFGTGEEEGKHLTKNGGAHTARYKPKLRAANQRII